MSIHREFKNRTGLNRSDRSKPGALPAADRKQRRLMAFTLIEIMAVVLIIGMLAGLVGLSVFSQVEKARVNTARTQIKTIEAALELYRLDNARYPTTEQGLDALIHAPSSPPVPHNYPRAGYMKGDHIPVDPWNSPYGYDSPGQHNARGFDLWSFGADGTPGGSDTDADVGNWSQGEN